MMISKVNSFQILDTDTLESIADYSGVENVTIESEIDTSSLTKEKLSFNHEASFECELTDCSLLFDYVNDLSSSPFYAEYYMPILVQARWHKKPRINKKWLKRYGMKKDMVLVRCNIDSFGQSASRDPYDSIEPEATECSMTLSDMQWKFRADQLRRNLKMEEYCR